MSDELQLLILIGEKVLFNIKIATKEINVKLIGTAIIIFCFRWIVTKNFNWVKGFLI